MMAGVLYALAAGLMWGLVFVAPVMLPAYPPVLLAAGRYLAFGLIALPLAWLDRKRLAQLTRADWVEAFRLTLIGNFLYYMALSGAIQRAGAPLPTMIIGTLPVVIAGTANLLGHQHERLAWGRLLPSLVPIAAGIACVNHVELLRLRQQADPDTVRYAAGIALALAALVCWTIYPIRNARWLRAHPDRSPAAWATAQGVVTLPVALATCALVGLARPWLLPTGFALPLGPRPFFFVALMVTIGLLASWLGTLCWNQASQRLPAVISGQLIVFEALAALGYAQALRGSAPPALTLLGAALLVAGVVLALRR